MSQKINPNANERSEERTAMVFLDRKDQQTMQERFENVTVLTQANIYEGGLCQSRTLVLPDGTKKTLGVYMPGDFFFDSHEPERVLMTSGAVDVLFPGDVEWRTVKAGENYDVPPNCTFRVRCGEVSQYICDFL
ncbi:pyrimidine/purine nucleoside phosphorylase [Synergistaceae bacterium OttesenSCG-928-I11]|nr:pyrimidine/purine nucleoside phosphorylase [Synergistaceae bacterium OttesenSCG-928-I11]